MTNEQKNAMMDISKSSLPSILVVTIMVFVAYSTFVLTTEKNRVDRRFEVAADLINELANSTRELTELLSIRTRSRWSKLDMANWCVQQKLKYPDLECPPLNAIDTHGDIHDSTTGIERMGKKFDKIKEKSMRAIVEGDHPTLDGYDPKDK